MSSAIARAGPALKQRPVDIDIAADLPFVTADALLLEHVLINLLENAAKYTPGGSRIAIAARRAEGGVRLEIADEGPGIPEADLHRIFERYYRAEDRDRRAAGAGLGLAICKGFMAAMGGDIVASNRAGGKGAVFTLIFPPALVLPPGEAEPAS